MKETKKNTILKKLLKIVLFFLLGFVLLLLVLGITLSLPNVQTKIAQKITEQLNKDFGTDISIEQATISVFGGIKLKKVLVKDHKNDTLFFINRLKTTIVDYEKLIDGDLHFGHIGLDGLDFHLKNYKGERDSNLDKFIQLFDKGEKSKSNKKFLLTAKKVNLTNSHFILLDENFNQPTILNIKRLNAITTNFKILGPNVTTSIDKMSFIDQRGLVINNLTSHFIYTKKNIILDKLDLKTPESKLKGDIALRYKREDFSDFNNKVVFDVKVNQASVSSNDLNLFYNEFGKNQRFDLNGNILGTLNDFTTNKLVLVDNNKSEIIGDFTFKNLFSKNKNDFYMKGDFSKISSTYTNLDAILPKILGDNLPSTFKKFGIFTLSGKTEVTLKTVKADVILKTALGIAKTNLSMTNIDNIDNATYIGNIKLDNFNLGKFLNRTDVGIVNIDLDVDGKGFKEKYLKTKLKGKAKSIFYNKYNYRNLVVDGEMIKSIFKGNISANDPNLIMDFDGTLDVSKRENKYDFHANVEYANLRKLKLYTADSISVFRGDVNMKLQGNSIDNLYGDVFINQTSYENNKETYFFDDFQVKSSFSEDRTRTITVNSPDIIEGKLEGKFQFNQLQKLIENSLGSLYANYSPNKVSKGQFLKFDFNVYSKLIEIFFPDISLGENTKMRGSINSDNDEFKFNFKSPNIVAYDNYFDNLNIDIDNKNPLYNAYIELDSVRTKYYKISELSLINVTANDTLFFRTEFKGGKKAQDFYNLNLYHTINEDNNSVVGIKKSEVNFKDYLWFLNENESKDNKVIFNKKLTDFSIEKIAMSHGNQAMELMGVLRDSTYKDLKLSFKDVKLDKITPVVENLNFRGNINGIIDFKQNNSVYEPKSSVTIDSLSINNFELGKLAIDVKGDNTFKTFNVKSVLKNKELESFSADGTIVYENKKTFIDLNTRLDNLNLEFFTPLGGEIITNIRGLASGTASFEGELLNPDVIGRLYLNKAGLNVPYLNVDYIFGNNTIADFSEDQFTFRNVDIYDSKYKTQGKFNGSIKHKKFSDWFLDLNISSNRFLALDTKDSDDALYYGTAFIDGDASIKGPVNGIVINVNAKSEKGTAIKIPMSDTETSSDKDFIKFTTVKDKLAQSVKKSLSKVNNGVQLNFDLKITKDANIEVIIDKNTGHALNGSGDGNLLMDINTNGKFNMWGDFIVDKGFYNFKYGNIIDKQFIVKEGGKINWDGDPLNATLDMEAVYKTEANPAILLENTSYTKKIPTEVVIKLSDKLTNPVPNISINFPTVSSVLRSELEYKLNDNDTRQTQAMALLSSGSFLSEKGVGENIITGNLLEKAGSIFQDIFSNEDDKLKWNVNYIQADKKNIETETEGRLIANLSTQISDRIKINGKFGVPVGGLNESVVVGDVEIEFRLNEDGTLNARAFNRESDFNYIVGDGVDYTQGLGIAYEVDFNTFKELINKITKPKKTKEEKDSNGDDPDSDLPNDLIRLSEEKQKKTTEKTKTPPETAPEIE